MAKKFNEYPDDEEIREGRGWLPTWWTVMLWLGFAYALVYGVYMHGVAGWSQEKQYADEVALYEQEHPVVQVSLNADGSNPYRGDAQAIERGMKTYQGVCAACHKLDMSGLVGPNLKDAAWLHGATDAAIFDVVMNGRVQQSEWKQNPPKGPMPPHKNSLGAASVLEVMAYLASQNATLKPQ